MSVHIGRRIKLTGVLCLICAGGIQARLFDLQITRHEEPGDEAPRTMLRSWEHQPDRGLILDRNQRTLVRNASEKTLVAHPGEINQASDLARILHPILGIPIDVLERRLTSSKTRVFLKRRLEPGEISQLRKLSKKSAKGGDDVETNGARPPRLEELAIPGLAIIEEPARAYLKSNLAGQLVGFVDIDSEGRGGIELQENKRMRGNSVRLQARRYGDRRSILDVDYMREVPLRGADVVLTIDETIQWIVEESLYRQCVSSSAESGMSIVMNPWNGDVLAMANYPPFDPERVGEYTQNNELGRARNRCIADLFEPGSTMKPFIAAAALEEGLVRTDTVFDCHHGIRWVRGRNKPIRDVHPLGKATVSDILIHSSNIGIGKIAELIVGDPPALEGKKRLYDYLSRCGFEGTTDIELPGETPMFFRPGWEGWRYTDILVLAFGAGPVMVSPIGLARSYCVLANGGVRVRPRIIKGYVGNLDGKLYENPVDAGERALSESTTHDVREMLIGVVENRTSQARSPWYDVGGKTGTAMKWVDGVYSSDHRVLSFAGFAPARDPAIVAVVILDEPKGFRYGNQAAAPVFREIVEETLAYLHIPPDRIPDEQEPVRDIMKSGPRLPAEETSHDSISSGVGDARTESEEADRLHNILDRFATIFDGGEMGASFPSDGGSFRRSSE